MRYPKKPLSKKTSIIAGSIIVIVIGILVGVIVGTHTHKSNQALIENPGYTTVLPEGKTITSLGGWERVSPIGKDPVYAYNDTLDGVAISVSEQPLPSAFKSDVENHVSTLAKTDSATDAIRIGDVTLYIGTSAKGPQSVYLAKNDLLILIKSEAKIKDATWSAYAASLK